MPLIGFPRSYIDDGAEISTVVSLSFVVLSCTHYSGIDRSGELNIGLGWRVMRAGNHFAGILQIFSEQKFLILAQRAIDAAVGFIGKADDGICG